MENTTPNGFEPMENAPAFDDCGMGWDDEIEKDGGDFILLAKGDYEFTVASFERGRYPGGDKIPACNKAVLYLKIIGKDAETGAEGEALVRYQMLLHEKLEGLLCEFFTGIGQRKKGEKIRMNWSQVAGATGKVKLDIREYNGKKFNEVKKFYEPSATQPQQTSFKAGEF